MTSFSGTWTTTYGLMDLTQQGDWVQGTYGAGATIQGRVREQRLQFEYEEPNAAGEGWFELLRPGKFRGQWRPHGVSHWGVWQGERGFDGIWDTSFGPMRLFHLHDRIHGFYEGLGAASVEGHLDNGQLVFRYQEPTAAGQGVFVLADDLQTFEGQWQADGGSMWQPWLGRRVRSVPGRSWLVVLEAHWQTSLVETEYSFGEMLSEFFARVEHVEVRHRFFPNEAGLAKWCRELFYLPEPTVLAIATHGNQRGLLAHGQPIQPQTLLDVLPWADNLQLVHFSACMMLQDGPASELARALHAVRRFPVSGYTTSVDWAASAIIEFTYFDLILSRGLSPAEAAAQLPRLFTFAGEAAPPDSIYRGAGFRILLP